MHEKNHKLQPNYIHTNIIYMYCIMYVLCMYGGIIAAVGVVMWFNKDLQPSRCLWTTTCVFGNTDRKNLISKFPAESPSSDFHLQFNVAYLVSKQSWVYTPDYEVSATNRKWRPQETEH